MEEALVSSKELASGMIFSAVAMSVAALAERKTQKICLRGY